MIRIQRQKKTIMSRKVFIPSRFNSAKGAGDLKPDMERTPLKIKINKPTKKGNKPGPGLLKDPKP